MKNRIVAAAAAALLFAACTESSSQSTPKPIEHRASAVVVPMPSQMVVAEERTPRDAGTMNELAVANTVQQDDGLPLEHAHKARVDHLARARELKETGDFDGAISEARRALFDDPSDVEAINLISRVGKLTGDKEYVAAAFGRLSALSPEDPVPMIQQARALLRTKDYEGAIKVAKIATGKDPENAEAFHVIGRAYLASGELQDAIDNFHKAIEIDPDHGYALNNLGFAYLRANENEQAALVLEKAAAVLPHIAYVQNNLGVAYERLGRTEEAKVAYQKSMDLSPRYVKARINSERMKTAKVTPEIPVDAQPMELDSATDIPTEGVINE